MCICIISDEFIIVPPEENTEEDSATYCQTPFRREQIHSSRIDTLVSLMKRPPVPVGEI